MLPSSDSIYIGKPPGYYPVPVLLFGAISIIPFYKAAYFFELYGSQGRIGEVVFCLAIGVFIAAFSLCGLCQIYFTKLIVDNKSVRFSYLALGFFPKSWSVPLGAINFINENSFYWIIDNSDNKTKRKLVPKAIARNLDVIVGNAKARSGKHLVVNILPPVRRDKPA